MKNKEKEIMKARSFRINDSLKEAIQVSANEHNNGYFDRELRDLAKLGLKVRNKQKRKK